MEKTMTFYCWPQIFTIVFLSGWNTGWFEASKSSMFNLSEFYAWQNLSVMKNNWHIYLSVGIKSW